MKWSLIVSLVFASSVFAQQGPRPPQSPPIPQEASKADSPPQAPPMVEDKKVESDNPKHKAAMESSERAGRAFVVFVGVQSRALAGADTYHTDTGLFRGDDRQRIFIRVGGKEADVYPDSSDAALLAKIDEMRGVSRTADPFGKESRASGKSRPGELVQRDDDGTGRGPWPKSLPFPENMRRYRPAKVTQSTFNKGTIEAVSRTSTEPHWQVPGGMLGVKGWRSDLYKTHNAVTTREWVNVEHSQDTRNPGSFLWRDLFGVLHNTSGQDELANTRKYPAGAAFMDVLSNAKGEVFEIRVREKNPTGPTSKHDGTLWESYIMYQNKKARPTGYNGLQQKCIECHNYLTNVQGVMVATGPGTGGYGVGLVVGGDTVFSDPFVELEK